MSTAATLYRDTLLEHYHHPRHRGELEGAEVVRRGSNPRCGDEVDVGINFSGDTLEHVRFRGRGCSICVASASLMCEAVTGKPRSEAARLYAGMHAWFDEAGTVPAASLQPLEAVRLHPARRRCVLLAWEALHEALDASR